MSKKRGNKSSVQIILIKLLWANSVSFHNYLRMRDHHSINLITRLSYNSNANQNLWCNTSRGLFEWETTSDKCQKNSSRAHHLISIESEMVTKPTTATTSIFLSQVKSCKLDLSQDGKNTRYIYFSKIAFQFVQLSIHCTSVLLHESVSLKRIFSSRTFALTLICSLMRTKMFVK